MKNEYENVGHGVTSARPGLPYYHDSRGDACEAVTTGSQVNQLRDADKSSFQVIEAALRAPGCCSFHVRNGSFADIASVMELFRQVPLPEVGGSLDQSSR